jgi:hypothetical protein
MSEPALPSTGAANDAPMLDFSKQIQVLTTKLAEQQRLHAELVEQNKSLHANKEELDAIKEMKCSERREYWNSTIKGFMDELRKSSKRTPDSKETITDETVNDLCETFVSGDPAFEPFQEFISVAHRHNANSVAELEKIRTDYSAAVQRLAEQPTVSKADEPFAKSAKRFRDDSVADETLTTKRVKGADVNEDTVQNSLMAAIRKSLPRHRM